MCVIIWWDRHVEWRAGDIIHWVKWLNSSLRTWTQSSAPTLKREVCVVADSCLLSQSLGSRNMGIYFINPSQWKNLSPKSGVWHLTKNTQWVLRSWPQHTCAYNYTQVHSHTHICTRAQTHICTHAHTHGGEKYTERM